MSYLLFLVIALIGCGEKNKPQEPGPVTHEQILLELYDTRLDEVKALQSEDGWIETGFCDAALWTGKLGTAHGIEINFRAAEYPGEPGRFNRRPPPFCEEGAGSASSWSRDMGMGLLAYAWRKGDLALVQDHAAHGKLKNWKMGEPLADGRVLYTPAMIGHLYQVIWALGGEDNLARTWPSLYQSGLDDFQAHLQAMDIWLRGEIAAKMRLSLIDVTDTMQLRIDEHAAREPLCPFYQYLAGVYSGNLQPAIDILLSPDYACEYFRDNEPQAKLGEWLFAASLTLERLGQWD